MWQRRFATEGLKGEYTLMVPRENSRIAGLEWFTINLNFLLRSDACKKKYNFYVTCLAGSRHGAAAKRAGDRRQTSAPGRWQLPGV